MKCPMKGSNDLLPFERIFEIVNGRSPIVQSRKKDGNRILIVCGQVLSSSLKEPRNANLMEWLAPLRERSAVHDEVFDMEVWDPEATHHAETSGIVNSYEQLLPERLECAVFDGMPISAFHDECMAFPFRDRISWYTERVQDLGISYIKALAQTPVATPEEARDLFDAHVLMGEEGSVLRTTEIWSQGRYPRGGFYRCTRMQNTQATIYKQKVYVTGDGYIVGIQQRRKLREDWPRTYTASGHLIRPLEKEAYVPTDMVGAFLVAVPSESCPDEVILTEVGFRKGFDLEWRRDAWHNYVRDPSTMLGRWIEFKHMPHGAKDGGKLRDGGLVRFRDDIPRKEVKESIDVPMSVSGAASSDT